MGSRRGQWRFQERVDIPTDLSITEELYESSMRDPECISQYSIKFQAQGNLEKT